jgi:hypothetical protein
VEHKKKLAVVDYIDTAFVSDHFEVVAVAVDKVKYYNRMRVDKQTAQFHRHQFEPHHNSKEVHMERTLTLMTVALTHQH